MLCGLRGVDFVGLKRLIHEAPLRERAMKNIVTCTCGAKINIAGIPPRKDGIKVWCKVCGTITVHHR